MLVYISLIILEEQKIKHQKDKVMQFTSNTNIKEGAELASTVGKGTLKISKSL